MSQQKVAPHFARILARWPVDRLRPEQQQFQKLLRSRISPAAATTTDSSSSASTTAPVAPIEPRDGLAEANAAYLLLDNAFAKENPTSARMMKPASAPEHYEKLGRELDEIPDRSWMAGMWKRLSNMVRMG